MKRANKDNQDSRLTVVPHEEAQQEQTEEKLPPRLKANLF